MHKIATIDFETFKIQNRPEYPPKPVGVAIIEPGKAPKYMAWGHPEGNNCTKRQAHLALRHLYNNYRILCHNAKFDLEIAEKHFDLPLIPKFGFEDTLFLAFLNDPRDKSLSLKPLADKYLDMEPEEQTKLYDWIQSHVFTSKKSGEGEV